MQLLPAQTALARRRSARVRLSCHCRLYFDDADLPARLVDLSEGGAGIELLMAFGGGRDMRRLHAISVEGLGYFDVELRWSSMSRLGVAFRAQTKARRKVLDYFATHAITPPPPDGTAV